MKILKKIFWLFFLLLIISLVGAYFTRNILVKYVLENSVEQATGYDLDVGRVYFDIKNSKIAIKDLDIKNPRGFKDELMFQAPEVFVDIKLSELLKRKLYFNEVRLHMNQLFIIKNLDGKMNVSMHQEDSVQQEKRSDSEGIPTPESKAHVGFINGFQIDLLDLKIGKMIYKDYTQGESPKVEEVNVNINEKLRNVTDVNSVLMIIFQNAMIKRAIPSLQNVDLDQLKTDAQGFMNTIKSQASEFKKIFGK